MQLSGTTFNCLIDSPGEVGLGNLSNNGNNLSGSFTATGNITAYSDERLKQNIETINGGLSKVLSMRGVTFTKDDKDDVGVIAQEVENVLPQIVMTANDGWGTKSVDYSRITAVLIEAVKELTKRVEELENK